MTGAYQFIHALSFPAIMVIKFSSGNYFVFVFTWIWNN